MSMHQFIFAEVIPIDMIPRTWRGNGSFRDILLLCAAVALVTMIALIWAVYFRKRRRHHHHHEHHSPAASAVTASGQASNVQSSTHRRRRRRRRPHRPRNPTLAETGGLPPVRPERPAEPLP